jgi:RimJ/RimL family protein N-acetyltransferase
VRVALRPVSESDLEVFYEHQRDPESVRMGAVPSRDHDACIAHWRTSLADESVTARTIEADGEVVGHVVSFERDGTREVGYWIAREHWGRGVASAALATFLAGEDTQRPLVARVAAHNRGSLRVLEKCGFVVTEELEDPEGDGIDEVRLRLT